MINKRFFYLLFILLSCQSKKVLFTTENDYNYNISKRQPNQVKEPIEIIGKTILFEKYILNDNSNIYYFRDGKSKRSPIVFVIQGSGCESLYRKEKNNEIYGDIHTRVANIFPDEVSILAVEKPGIKTFSKTENPGLMNNCSSEFKKSFSLSNWIQILKSSLSDVISNKNLEPEKIILFGHSEGAIVAVSFAAQENQISHIIYSAGGGNPLFESIMRRRKASTNNLNLENEYINEGLKNWMNMNSNNDIQKLVMGHTPLYWSSFFNKSVFETLKETPVKLYIVQGTSDDSASIESNDLLLAELTMANRKFEYKRIPNADHSYKVNGISIFNQVIFDALNWAINN